MKHFLTSNAAKWVKTFFGVTLLLAGIVNWAIAIVILALALLLAGIGFEWDGPVLWDRVLRLVMLPGLIGTLLVALAYPMVFRRSDDSR